VRVSGLWRLLPPPQVNLRTLLLTLIEIASACGYLHRMGVVHCDIKVRPAHTHTNKLYDVKES
jgi:serine/threonine protein kinase